jgi:hypothetical protein
MGKMERSRLDIRNITYLFYQGPFGLTPSSSMVKTLLDNEKQLLFPMEQQDSTLPNVTRVISASW